LARLILITFSYNGLGRPQSAGLHPEHPAARIDDGGLLNAIVGSIIMTVIAVGIGAPLGLFAGTYLAEIRPQTTD